MAKTILSYQDQISQLQSEKQLLISNPASGKYLHGVTFEEIVAFYYFDDNSRITI